MFWAVCWLLFAGLVVVTLISGGWDVLVYGLCSYDCFAVLVYGCLGCYCGLIAGCV